MKTQRLAAVIAMLALALGLPIADATPSFAATRLSVSPPNPVAREYITIAGRFGTAIQRPVQLQFKTSSGWKSLATKTTAATGKFAFKTRAVAPSRTFRALAPRVVKNGRRFSALSSDPRTVKTVKATAAVALVPAPVGQAKSGTTDLTPGKAVFKPARKGRGVKVQRLSGSSWVTVATGRQDRRGAFAFNIPATSGQTFRAVTVAMNGAPTTKSTNVTARYLTKKFGDEFLGTALDLNVWEHRMLGQRNPGGKRACSESSTRSVSVSDGNLRLRTIRIPTTDDPLTLDKNEAEDYVVGAECPKGQWYNGHIGTKAGTAGDFKYGIMAARIRLQPHQGHHGGFWSQPRTSPAMGAEIDAVEYYGDAFRNGAIQHSIYRESELKAKVVQARNYLLASGQTFSNSYHVFSVEWTPSRYIFRIDGIETFRTSQAVSQTDQYLILSLLASDYELAENTPGSTPMYVDWVRTWGTNS